MWITAAFLETLGMSLVSRRYEFWLLMEVLSWSLEIDRGHILVQNKYSIEPTTLVMDVSSCNVMNNSNGYRWQLAYWNLYWRWLQSCYLNKMWTMKWMLIKCWCWYKAVAIQLEKWLLYKCDLNMESNVDQIAAKMDTSESNLSLSLVSFIKFWWSFIPVCCYQEVKSDISYSIE